MIKVIKQINERQILIEQDGKNFFVSESIPDLVPQETLVFSCDSEGKISAQAEVGGSEYKIWCSFGCQYDANQVYKHKKENCVSYQEGGLPCEDCEESK